MDKGYIFGCLLVGILIYQSRDKLRRALARAQSPSQATARDSQFIFRVLKRPMKRPWRTKARPGVTVFLRILFSKFKFRHNLFFIYFKIFFCTIIYFFKRRRKLQRKDRDCSDIVFISFRFHIFLLPTSDTESSSSERFEKLNNRVLQSSEATDLELQICRESLRARFSSE